MSKKTIAVIGASGFVGSQIVNAIIKSNAYELVQIHRKDSAEELCSTAGIIVHSANPARRFNAENHPILPQPGPCRHRQGGGYSRDIQIARP